MKILNLYAGIGGNRKLWGDEHEITAVEYDPKIAAIYSDFFPNDTMVVADAHQYLLDHWHEFDFIWSSPPCPTHTKVNKAADYRGGKLVQKAKYTDMTLWQEILFLQRYSKAKWCVENVLTWYEPFIRPQEIGSNYYWCNFTIPPRPRHSREHHNGIEKLTARKGFDISKYMGIDKRQVLRNCVEPEMGYHIFMAAQGTHYHSEGIELVALDLGLL